MMIRLLRARAKRHRHVRSDGTFLFCSSVGVGAVVPVVYVIGVVVVVRSTLQSFF